MILKTLDSQINGYKVYSSYQILERYPVPKITDFGHLCKLHIAAKICQKNI